MLPVHLAGPCAGLCPCLLTLGFLWHLLPVVWQESRPRFWFVAVAQCSSAATVTPGEKVPLNYELHYLNPGGTFQRQFSKDRQLEFEASIAALCIYVVLLVPMAYGAIFKSKSTALGVWQTRAVIV